MFHHQVFFELASEVEVIPTDDAILDQSITGFRNFLIFLFGLCKLTRVANSHGARETVGQHDLVELFFDGLP